MAKKNNKTDDLKYLRSLKRQDYLQSGASLSTKVKPSGKVYNRKKLKPPQI